MQPLTRSLSIALLIGTALLGVGALLHPILPHDPSAQLRMIAEKKLADLNAHTVEQAIPIIAGTARSMGVEVVD